MFMCVLLRTHGNARLLQLGKGITMNYKESQITGQQWTRCFDVRCRNPYEGAKEIEFSEEVAINLGDKVITQPTGSRITELLSEANANALFDLLNPETGESFGTASYTQCYVMLHSMYMHLANKRDNPPATEPLPEPVPTPEGE